VNVTAFDPGAIEAADNMQRNARLYIEGTIKLDKWTGQDGVDRHGLSVMSWHCRLAAIGKNKPKRNHTSEISKVTADSGDREKRIRGTAEPGLNDEIPF
jgi:single-stranded DNA-binding protein